MAFLVLSLLQVVRRYIKKFVQNIFNYVQQLITQSSIISHLSKKLTTIQFKLIHLFNICNDQFNFHDKVLQDQLSKGNVALAVTTLTNISSKRKIHTVDMKTVTPVVFTIWSHRKHVMQKMLCWLTQLNFSSKNDANLFLLT